MSPTPKDFFVGLIDFFSILLPGAVLSYYLQKTAAASLLPKQLERMSEAERWMVFAVSSYLLGHFLFLLGAWLDEFYDYARGRTRDDRIKRLARRGDLGWKLGRLLLWLAFKREQNFAVDRAARIRKHSLKPLAAQKSVNTFQWAKARLALENHEGAVQTVQRFEADSKFFRSLVPVLIILPFLAGWENGWVFWTLAPLALWRYMDQRHKATNQAYWYILALDGKNSSAAPPIKPRADGLTHAGGVVYRIQGGRVEYLLVETSKQAKEWVLPKGHFELDEEPMETAIREVNEETGVWAAIEKELGDSQFIIDQETVKVRFYLMRCLEEPYFPDTLRRSCWLTFDEAKANLRYPESITYLEHANRILSDKNTHAT
jgi:8-oxo-dGTP pyrophosphatase MutT (NUDIX family)